MNYIREAEKYLKHYRDLKYSLERIEREITRLKFEGAPRDISSPIIDGMPHSSFNREDMLNIVFKLRIALESKRRTEEKIAEIDDVLATIDKEPGCENYSRVLKMWYVERLPKEEIAEKIGYSPYSRKSIYRIKNEAIRKFAIRLFGLPALEAV